MVRLGFDTNIEEMCVKKRKFIGFSRKTVEIHESSSSSSSIASSEVLVSETWFSLGFQSLGHRGMVHFGSPYPQRRL